MEHWWKRNNDLDLGSYTQDEVEDLTGCIPLLLSSCMVNEKIDLCVDVMWSVWKQVATFIADMKEAENPDA